MLAKYNVLLVETTRSKMFWKTFIFRSLYKSQVYVLKLTFKSPILQLTFPLNKDKSFNNSIPWAKHKSSYTLMTSFSFHYS